MNTEHHLGYLFFILHRSTPIIFSTGRRPAYGQPKGRRSIIMPWAIPPWLALVEFLGLTAKEYDKHDNNKITMTTTMVKMATTMASKLTTRMALMMVTTTKGKWMVMVVATTMTTMMTLLTQWDNNNAMATAMMGQQ
jgi:hypothetical protein